MSVVPSVQASPRRAFFHLNDGHHLPLVGLGTFGMTGEDGITAITAALHCGYRLLDTAEGYGNEFEVGEAIRRSDIPSSEIIVTSKINGKGHGYDQARQSIDRSRKALRLDQIGLHLIHWPTPSLGQYVNTWKALVKAQIDGDVRSIGVSNFTPCYLTRIIEATGVVPAINQVELHPHFPQEEQRAFNLQLGIITQSWSPLGRGPELFEAPEVMLPARRLKITAAQVILRWHHQLGVLPIPRSMDNRHQQQNLAFYGLELTSEEMNAITALGLGGKRLWNGDPDTVAFM